MNKLVTGSVFINSYLDLETSIRFCGSHKEAPAYYRKLDGFISEHRLKITGFSKEITMIDYGITNDTDQFVTEIQIPVEPAI